MFAADNVLAEVGLTSDIALRHELGHCNGWIGHDGARYLDAVPAPQMTLDELFSLKVPK